MPSEPQATTNAGGGLPGILERARALGIEPWRIAVALGMSLDALTALDRGPRRPPSQLGCA